jgi:hypothetical protein
MMDGVQGFGCGFGDGRNAGGTGVDLVMNGVQGVKVWILWRTKCWCSLSLWRVVQGIKLMHLDLIHGLFIT